jgi:hypothetical protein
VFYDDCRRRSTLMNDITQEHCMLNSQISRFQIHRPTYRCHALFRSPFFISRVFQSPISKSKLWASIFWHPIPCSSDSQTPSNQPKKISQHAPPLLKWHLVTTTHIPNPTLFLFFFPQDSCSPHGTPSPPRLYI